MIANAPRTKKTLQAPLAANIAAFEQHKKTLLDILRKVHGGGPKSEPFVEDKAWGPLTRAAQLYFRRPEINRKTVLPARRADRLRDLARALRRARLETHKAMQDDVGWDLVRGWCAVANVSSALTVLDDGRLSRTPIANQFKAAVAGLTALEAAANRAASDVPAKAGAPRGTGLVAMQDIVSLAAAYRRSTGQNPVMGPGDFASLVEEFLIAVGQGNNTSRDYVFEALKYARKQARKSSGK